MVQQWFKDRFSKTERGKEAAILVPDFQHACAPPTLLRTNISLYMHTPIYSPVPKKKKPKVRFRCKKWLFQFKKYICTNLALMGRKSFRWCLCGWVLIICYIIYPWKSAKYEHPLFNNVKYKFDWNWLCGSWSRRR